MYCMAGFLCFNIKQVFFQHLFELGEKSFPDLVPLEKASKL